MRCLSQKLVLLVLLAAIPAAVYAQGLKVYADSTGSAGSGAGPLGGGSNPVPINAQSDFDTAINLLTNKTGTLVYIFKVDSGVQWCEYTITNGAWGPPRNCSPGYPPETGTSIAPGAWWILALLAAIALVATGLFLRWRGTARA